MSSNTPEILALDFDGVVCDGLAEYFQSSKQAYQEIWPESKINDDLASDFGKLRPVIETGWEMPILLRALVLGIREEEIRDDWHSVCQQIVNRENLASSAISQTLDGVRDSQIQSDLQSWLALHRFYPGVIDKIKKTLDEGIILYIITTKEGRFVEELLSQANLKIPSTSIFGKECKQPKYKIITQILDKLKTENSKFWFVEDRLKTLQLVKQQDNLNGLGLFLASWGYNTKQIQESIRGDRQVKLLSLSQFTADFTQWL